MFLNSKICICLRATLVRLDRVLYNQHWDDAFPNAIIQGLTSACSDHCPLLLTSNAAFRPQRCFRFKNVWTKLEGFDEIVRQASALAPSVADPFLNLSGKLAHCAKKLKAWASSLIGDIKLRMQVINEIIFQLDKARDHRQLSAEEHTFRGHLKVQCLGLAALDRCMWRQRSRYLWLREGDCNSRIFHQKANARRRKNMIPSLMINGSCVADQVQKEECLWNHFHDLLGTYHPRTASLNLASLSFPLVDLQDLENPMSLDEIKAAILEIHPEKAPGPDGYTGLFYRRCWEVIKHNLLTAFLHFQNLNTQNLDALNCATMILLPKHAGANTPQEFRPISLIHIFAKITAKILSTRLQPKMNMLISQCQSAFIKGRVIHDNFIYVQSMARVLRQKKIPSLLPKLDISKAFDSVSWEFLLALQQRGFGSRWQGWLASLFLTCSTKVLINSVLSDKIFHMCGLRQGDPLSPLLFVLVIDCLARLMDKAQLDGILAPLCDQTLRHRTSIYADDVMIFVNPSVPDVMAPIKILKLFGDSTGLHTNLQKSKVLPIRCDDIDINPFLQIMGCHRDAFPCTYLGMPLSDKKLRKVHLPDIIDKLAKKAAGWKGRWISIDGRLILVKFVMAAMPVFQLLAIDYPKWTQKVIEKIQGAFLWTGTDTVSGGKCLVKWSQLCYSLQLGGLDIPNMQLQSNALKLRWLWQSKTEDDKPWLGMPHPYSPAIISLFQASTIIIIGDGKNTSFWHDHWLEGSAPKGSLPQLIQAFQK
ncbi:unnamed protein product [Alopecurus aequalis]